SLSPVPARGALRGAGAGGAERLIAEFPAGAVRSRGEQAFRPVSPVPYRFQDFRGADMDKEQEKAAKARDAALNGALSQIERQFGKGSIMRMGDEDAAVRVDAIPTGALSLDIALGVGGMPRGRIVEVFGPESSGKTTLLYHLLSEAQKKGG